MKKKTSNSLLTKNEIRMDKGDFYYAADYWRDKMKNEELYERTKENHIKKLIQFRRLSWFWHVMRMNGSKTTRKIFDWEPKDTRKL